jgi:biotin transport system substrate-specific component
MSFYLSGGILGLPWFSGSVAGLAILKSPTVGYLIGFIMASWLIGKFSNYPYLSILLGTSVIYLFGTIGLSLVLQISILEAIKIGVLPFLIGDLIKALAAFGIAKKINI